jgi:hypothetical protein
MAKIAIKPFRNESDCISLGGLTIENRLDRVSIFGSLDLTLDREGLAYARELKGVLELTLAEMEQAELPDKISTAAAETVDNPFQ